MVHQAVALLAALVVAGSDPGPTNEQQVLGKRVYNTYCYQCHGYSGDARTLARSFVDPPPRAFTETEPTELTQSTMIGAVTRGRPGTAMASFASVLTTSEIEAVVAYIRGAFMGPYKQAAAYHTPENGWRQHDRYAPAFPFATGAIALDTPWEALSAEHRVGKRLYLSACISCHDRGRVLDEGPAWELSALSQQRPASSGHATDEDDVYNALPYSVHDQPRVFAPSDPAAQRGERYFRQHCAFCHAADGTGRNWIGSFLEPHPPDLTTRIPSMGVSQIKQTIRDGIPNTSMPAWKHVLDTAAIDDITVYLKQAFTTTAPGQPESTGRSSLVTPVLKWSRQMNRH